MESREVTRPRQARRYKLAVQQGGRSAAASAVGSLPPRRVVVLALAAFAVVCFLFAGDRSLVLSHQAAMQAELDGLRDRLQEQPIGPVPLVTPATRSMAAGPPPAPAASAPPAPALATGGGLPPASPPSPAKATARPLSGFTRSTPHVSISEDKMVATHAGGIGRSDPGLADEWGSAIVGDVMWAPATRPSTYYAEFVLRRAPGGAAIIGLVEAGATDPVGGRVDPSIDPKAVHDGSGRNGWMWDTADGKSYAGTGGGVRFLQMYNDG